MPTGLEHYRSAELALEKAQAAAGGEFSVDGWLAVAQIEAILAVASGQAHAMQMPTVPLTGREGDRVRQLREARRLTQTDVAKAMSTLGFAWHQQTVARVEDGDRKLRLDEASGIAQMFGVDLAELVRESEER